MNGFEALALGFTPIILILAVLIIKQMRSTEYKRMKFFMEEEYPLFRRIGLESFIYHISSGGFLAEQLDFKKITFYHPQVRFNVDYNFNEESANVLTGKGEHLRQLLNEQNRELKKELKSIEDKAKKFMVDSGINYSLHIIVPMILIFGFDAVNIVKAIETEAHPAVVAALVRKYGIDGFFKNYEAADLPIAILAKVYDLDYEERKMNG